MEKLYRKGKSEEEWQDWLDDVPHSFWSRHVRRVAPEPNVMARDVIAVYQAFVGRRDPETADADEPEGYLFFTGTHRQRFEKQLKYICSGALSDPPDMSFYTTVGR